MTTDQVHRDWLAGQLARIPLTAAMQVTVERQETLLVELVAPLLPNRNDKGSAFGGSIASLLTLAGWSLLTRTLHSAGLDGAIYIQDANLAYLSPGWDTLRARASASPEVIERFVRQFHQRGRARAEVGCELVGNPRPSATMAARYVALPA